MNLAGLLGKGANTRPADVLLGAPAAIRGRNMLNRLTIGPLNPEL